jgi:adenine-specific DNA-methyltransferase
MALKLGEKYLSGQIITYMGNKRKLLPVIGALVDNIQTELGYSELTIGDGFSGSGIVSRLLKTKASKLYSNDLAGYSKTLNECYLATPDEKTLKQIKVYICGVTHGDTPSTPHDISSNQIINGVCGVSPPFVSGNWAPASPLISENDRVFFTYENGKRIDYLRDYIATLPPAYQPFLLAPLLVECSIHNNTNGQFSAFYKDAEAAKGAYGGKGGIDLKRITQPITIPFPLFDPHPCQVVITQLDTNAWAKKLGSEVELDIVYYDPPYNKHPYNIYYFMLDVINNWDKTTPIPATNRGQPKDRTKSLYNSSTNAKEALDDLLANTKAKYIILSYNDGGIIPIPELDTLLAKHGQHVEKIPLDHKTYNRLKGISNYKRTQEYKAVKEYMYVVKR